MLGQCMRIHESEALSRFLTIDLRPAGRSMAGSFSINESRLSKFGVTSSSDLKPGPVVLVDCLILQPSLLHP